MLFASLRSNSRTNHEEQTWVMLGRSHHLAGRWGILRIRLPVEAAVFGGHDVQSVRCFHPRVETAGFADHAMRPEGPPQIPRLAAVGEETITSVRVPRVEVASASFCANESPPSVGSGNGHDGLSSAAIPKPQLHSIQSRRCRYSRPRLADRRTRGSGRLLAGSSPWCVRPRCSRALARA